MTVINHAISFYIEVSRINALFLCISDTFTFTLDTFIHHFECNVKAYFITVELFLFKVAINITILEYGVFAYDTHDCNMREVDD